MQAKAYAYNNATGDYYVDEVGSNRPARNVGRIVDMSKAPTKAAPAKMSRLSTYLMPMLPLALILAGGLSLWDGGTEVYTRWTYGPVPTSYTSIDVGHGGVSTFSVSNINGTLRVVEFLPGTSHTSQVYQIATGLDHLETANLSFDTSGNMTVNLYPRAHLLFWTIAGETEHYLFVNHTDTNVYTAGGQP